MSWYDYIPTVSLYDEISGNSQNDPYHKALFGGDATKGLNPQGQYGAQLGGQLQGYLGQAGQNPLNFGQANQDRANMGVLAGQLQGVASGQQRGAGEMAVNRQVGQATASQQAAAQMAQGANAALAARNAARNTADLGVNGAGMAQQAALQDQTSARGQLAGLYGQMQGGDLQQQSLGLQQYGAQNQARQGYLQQLLGLNQQGFQNQATINGIAQNDKGYMPYLLQMGGQAAMASDERLKTDVTEASHETDRMMGGLKAYSYRYKDEKYGIGKRVGILAQDLERSSMGRDTVVDLANGEGKGVDIVKGLSASLAGIARLHERLSAVEAK